MSEKWLRHIFWPALLALTLLLYPASACAIAVIGDPVAATATIESQPKVLNIRGNGTFGVVIELPSAQGAEMIDPGTVAITRVGGEVVEPLRPVPRRPIVGDSDEDGIADMKLQFRRCDLRNVLPGPLPAKASILLTISGQLTDGSQFEGTEEVRLIYRK